MCSRWTSEGTARRNGQQTMRRSGWWRASTPWYGSLAAPLRAARPLDEGRNAYTYTAQHTEEVERLVIVDIGPEIVPAGSERIRSGVLTRDVFDDSEEAYRAARAANPRPPEAELRHRMTSNLMQRDDSRWTWRYDKALRAPDRPLPRPDPEAAWALLPQITCPTLLVRGAESDILSRETAERMVREIPNCRLVEVPDAGHSVPLDNPAGFIAAIDGFLS